MWDNLWTLRNRTSIFIIPPEIYHRQEDIASDLPEVTVINWLNNTIASSNISHKFINSSVDSELNKIRQAGNSAEKVFCFINNEYFLTKFNSSERQLFWQNLHSSFPYTKGVIVFFILDAPELLPNKLELDEWKEEERLFSFKDVFKESE